MHVLVRSQALGILCLAGLLACGDDAAVPSDTETGSASDSGSDAATPMTGTSASTSTGTEPPADTTDASDGSSSDGGSSSTGEPASFACPPAPFELQCDLVAQDCPPGLHCLPWSTDGIVFDSTVCGELSAAPAERYDACAQDADACTDDCEAGTFCRRSSEDDLSGVCLGMCTGDGDDTGCAADEVCASCAECVVNLCLPSCDPLAPECPDGAPSCVPLSHGEFACVPGDPIGTGGPGDSCVDLATCAPGHACLNADHLGESCRDAACCTEHCDLEDGEPGCSAAEHVCIPFYLPGNAPKGLEHVGVCALPSADPCLVPGACPPPDIDDTYPWCSPINEGACDGLLGGYGDPKACEEGCLCATACTRDDDCPAPPTGTAVPDCVEAPLGVGSPTSCLLSCAGDETCPDGMTCTDFFTGEPLCMWVSPLPPEEC